MLIFSLIMAIVLYVFMIIMNVLANSLPLGGISTGGVSFNYPNLFQPAGLTFSIWGVIYVMLGVFLAFQLQALITSNLDGSFQKIHWLFALTSILNVLWLWFWHHQKIGLSTVVMILLLIVLGIIVFGFSQLPSLTIITFSIYLGWISVATIANITIYLVKLGVPSLGSTAVLLTVFVLIIGLIIGLLVLYKKRNFAYGLVFIWAYLGITIRHIKGENLNMSYPAIYVTSICSILILVSMSLYLYFSD